MRLRDQCIQKRSHFSQKSKPYMNRRNPSFPLPSLSGAGACAVLISRASRTSERSQSTTATRRALISPMQSTLWPTASRRTRRGRRLLRVIFRTKEIGSGNKNILIARLGRLGSELATTGTSEGIPGGTYYCRANRFRLTGPQGRTFAGMIESANGPNHVHHQADALAVRTFR